MAKFCGTPPTDSIGAGPQTPQLQQHLWEMAQVLAMSTELTGDEKLAAFLLCNEPLRAFDGKTANSLVQEGRTEAVIAYLESFAGGSAG